MAQNKLPPIGAEVPQALPPIGSEVRLSMSEPRADEPKFRQWYQEMSKRHNLNPDPEGQFYDYRAAFQANAAPDASGHWPSQFKQPGHPDLVVGGFHTQTGERVKGTPRADEPELVRLGWSPEAAKQLAAQPEQPDFKSSNELDEQGQAKLRPQDRSKVGEFLVEATAGINPLNWAKAIGSAIKDPKAAAQAMYEGRTALSNAAMERFQKGDYVGGTAKTIEWLIPFLGERMSQAGDYMEQGEWAKGLGAAVDAGGQVVLPKALAGSKAAAQVGPVFRNPNPVERAAVAYGQREGIPVDAATATGNRYVGGMQKVASESLVGSGIGGRAVQAQGDALAATMQRAMDKVSPAPVTADMAGEGARTGVYKAVQKKAREADRAYSEVRKAEGNYANGEYVAQDVSREVKAKMQESLGEVPSGAEIAELRRMYAEMDAVPYQKGKQITDDATGERGGMYSHREAGAPVYRDIINEAPGTSRLDRGDVMASIKLALDTGRFTNGARGALDVARKRLSEKGWRMEGLSSPILPPGAGTVEQGMLLPVDLRQVKSTLAPLAKKFADEKELTGSLHGMKARAALAINDLMLAPDHAPLSVVDGALSELKAMARSGSDVPELRGAGRGAVAFAVRHIDNQVRAAAAKAGPEVLESLQRGRAATRAKYAAGEILESLPKEPVELFKRLTSRSDTRKELLTEVGKLAPAELPKIGRAVLEGIFEKATREGGFKRAQGLQADWVALGPETKRLLFRDEALIRDLDNFFLLAKKIAENPNPSGTALTLLKTGETTLLWNNPMAGAAASLGAGALAKLLYSPKAVKLLTRGLQLPVGNKAAATAFGGELAQAAREVGVTVPAMAKDDKPVRVGAFTVEEP